MVGGGGGCNPKNRRPPQISNLGLVFLGFLSFFFSVFPFWPILTGLTGSDFKVVLVGYSSFYKTCAGFNIH